MRMLLGLDRRCLPSSASATVWVQAPSSQSRAASEMVLRWFIGISDRLDLPASTCIVLVALKVEASYVFEATYLAPCMGLGPLRTGVARIPYLNLQRNIAFNLI